MVGVLPCSRRMKYSLVLLLLVGYVFMTGSRVSVIRAVIMVGCLYTALMIERESDSLNALGLAAIIIFMMNPMTVFQVGFQLSFLSVLSILMILPQSDNWLVLWTGWNKRFMQSMMVSMAAWLGTFGLVAYYFGIITPIAIVANMVIVPMMSVVVVLSAGLLVTSVIPLLASSFAFCLKVVLNVMAACAYLLSHIPGAYVMVDVSWKAVFIYYVVISGILFVYHQRKYVENSVKWLGVHLNIAYNKCRHRA